MSGFELDVSEFAAYAKQLQTVSTAGALEYLPDVAVAGGRVYRTARQHAPVKTGAMRAAIRIDNVSGSRVEASATVVAAKSYSRYVERGTYKMRPRPFMRPAVDYAWPKLVDDVGVRMRSDLRAWR